MDLQTPCEQYHRARTSVRRVFLRWLTAIWGMVAAVILIVPLIGYCTGLRRRQEYWVDAGPVGDFPVGETRRLTFDNPLRQPWDGITALTIVYARYQGHDAAGADQFLVLSANCAHLGCPVTWFPQSGLFMCPCHGGVYYANGERAAGPPPRGLYHCEWRIDDGRLQIRAPHYPTLQDPLVPNDEHDGMDHGSVAALRQEDRPRWHPRRSAAGVS